MVLALLAGCATTANPDPLEPMNRKVYAFNDAVDRAVVKPVATAYKEHVPAGLRMPVTSFFGNLKDVWSAANLVLQGRFADALNDSFRVLVNTVFGVGGLADVATPMGLQRHNQDLGQTLGKWGFGPGAYLVLPLLGPSSVRDVTDVPFELVASPTTFVKDAAAQWTLSGVNLVDTRANLLGVTNLLDDQIDPYAFTRSAYLQRRRSLVYDGDPPPEPDDADDAAAAPAAPAAPAASAAASAPAAAASAVRKP